MDNDDSDELGSDGGEARERRHEDRLLQLKILVDLYVDTNSKEKVKIKDATQIVRQLSGIQTQARPAKDSAISLSVCPFLLFTALTL